MADSDFFDYVKVGQADNMEPFSMEDVLKLMSPMKSEDASFVGSFYGPPGTRKTTRTMELAQAITPPDQKILYVYTGQGWTSLMNFPHLMERTIKMPFVRYEQIETLRNILLNEQLRNQLKIGAVVFDEYNRMQDMDTDILTKHRAQLVNKVPSYDKSGARIYKDPDTPEWPEYNTTKVRLINLINDLLVVPKLHSFFVCHTRLQKKTGMIEPDFPFAAGSAFTSMIHSLYYCTKEDAVQGGKPVTIYPIELEGTGTTASKNRIGGLPSVVYTTEPIAIAYKKWGIREESVNTIPTPQVETKQEIPATEEKAPVENVVDIDPLAALMGE
jgi:hypothetical protein